MKHISDPLNRLHQEGSWFARAHEFRLLVVRVAGDVRGAVIKLLPGFEFHADNRSPWVVLDDAYSPSEPNWITRATRLVLDWEKRREAFAKVGVQLPALDLKQQNTLVGDAHWSGDLVVFANTAECLIRALAAPLAGLVVVLAPALVEGMDRFEQDVARLLSDASLKALRFVVVLDDEVPAPRYFANSVPGFSLICDCSVNSTDKQADLAVLVSGSGKASVGAGAGPLSVTPPQRANKPPPIPAEKRDALLREAGVDPAYMTHAPRLRQLILGAAMDMADGRGAEAISRQREAVGLCSEIGLHQAKVICQITLASYLSADARMTEAIRELEVAAADAAAHQLPDQESQAYLAQGLLYTLNRQPMAAATVYYQCARVAESGKALLLAVEGWRLAGQAALSAGATEVGVQYMQHALAVAGQLEPSAQQNSSAPEVARQLAKLYEGWSYDAHAKSLYDLADRLEQGNVDSSRMTAISASLADPAVTEPGGF